MKKPFKGPNVNFEMLNELTRVYPRAVSGTPSVFYYEPARNTFHMEYMPNAAVRDLPTEICVPPAKFPRGYIVTVAGGKVISKENAAGLLIVADGKEKVVVDLRPRTLK